MELRKLLNEEIKTIIVPELRKYNFKGSFPHFRRIYENGYHFNLIIKSSK